MLEVRTKWEGGTLIARTLGRIDGSNVHEFERALHAPIDTYDSTLILDVQALSYISSAGLRVILMAARMLQVRGG